jgi:chromosome segregation ATPase
MKRIIPISIVALMMAFTSCDNKAKEVPDDDTEAIAAATQEELAQAVSDRDELLALVNEISGGVQEIKEMENILTVQSGGAEGETSQREQIKADIAALKQALQDRRERLAQLEKKLNASALNTKSLQKTIASLKAQIDEQTATIATLTENLNLAHARIADLESKTDSLTNTVNNVTSERDAAQEETINLANEMNTCYYAVGSKSELKERKIIETGFLRKTKLMKGDFDQNFFTIAERRSLTVIHLHSKKAQVLTNQPSSSYTLTEEGGQMVLRITNPDSFWNLSNYLVVQVD